MPYSDDQPRDDNGRWASFGGDLQSDQAVKAFFKPGSMVRDRHGKISQVIGVNNQRQVVSGRVSRVGDIETASDLAVYHPKNLSVRTSSSKRSPMWGGPGMTSGNKRVAVKGKY